ncbi:FadR/GntR family transcriptional regulator [Bradyrhizobium sp. NP1]|uniref:FadR/GntR family transcriptional regulator n=1 Tax=Bradyrhizobium sp. NP1 TaxID=3049772 RepID=UPI0025A6250E|nr:FadR/GntR family transcriptional regulator [Bradyrhizobium sp. NP1]WJR75072.1 FadR/GntR family transcriptional regulator [Bradyrhizobium sp. NP1]
MSNLDLMGTCVPLADDVVWSLRKMLDSGNHPVGTRLPAERNLCAELKVSRTVLRTALARLEAEGRLWRNVGQGTFVGGRPVKTGNAIVLASALTSPAEVMEVRLVIEPPGAFHAAIRATEDDIAHLQHCLSKLDGSPNHANYARWDSTFHRGIFEAAHNSLLLMLFDAVNDVRSQASWSSVWERMLTPNRAAFRQQHKRIVEAIASRNPASAQEQMRAHLDLVRDAISFAPTYKHALADGDRSRSASKMVSKSKNKAGKD